MTSVTNAPKSDDGNYWWDGTSWQPVPGTAAADNWPILQEAVIEEADHRLHALKERITTTVGTFHNDAITQIEHEIHGPAENGMLDGIFSGLLSVVVAAIPGEKLIEEVGKEAMKAFVEVFKKGADDYAKKTVEGRVEEAKDEMRRRVDDLYAEISADGDLAVAAADAQLHLSLQHFITANPNYRHVRGDDVDDMKAAVCDHIGIHDEWPGAEFTAHLWSTFHHDFYRVTARLNFYNIDNDILRLMFLLEKIEPTTNVGEFLRAINADVHYWEYRVGLYHSQYPDQAADGMLAMAIIEYAALHPEGA